MKTYDELRAVSDEFFGICDRASETHPWAVCIAMHEYYRSLYPADPYIPLTEGICPTERVYALAIDLTSFMQHVLRLGAYKAILERPWTVSHCDGDVGRVRYGDGELRYVWRSESQNVR